MEECTGYKEVDSVPQPIYLLSFKISRARWYPHEVQCNFILLHAHVPCTIKILHVEFAINKPFGEPHHHGLSMFYTFLAKSCTSQRKTTNTLETKPSNP